MREWFVNGDQKACNRKRPRKKQDNLTALRRFANFDPYSKIQNAASITLANTYLIQNAASIALANNGVYPRNILI
jgi:hypothetical protein